MKHIPLTLVALFLSACGGGGTDSPIAGACVHSYLEPIVLIDSVTVAGTSDSVSAVTLDDISMNGQVVDLPSIASTLKNSQIAGLALTCSAPCGFGNLPGAYVMQVRAPGFKPRQVSVAATYTTFTAGCPSSNSGGSRVAVALERL